MKIPKKKLNGFTLVEAILAIFIISLTFIAMMKMFNVSLLLGIRAQNLLIATNLAQEGIEEIRNIGYTVPLGDKEEEIEGIPPSTKRIVEVSWVNDPEGSGKDYKKVRVKIEWYEENQKKSIELITYLSAHE